MKLNKLGCQILESEYKFHPRPWVEFLVDGESIDSLLKTGHKSIPLSYFKNDLPSYFDYFLNKEIYNLAICKCGESSCGSVKCIIEKKNDFVIFKEIFIGINKFPNLEFKFSRENFDEVIKEIVEKQDKYKEDSKSK